MVVTIAVIGWIFLAMDLFLIGLLLSWDCQRKEIWQTVAYSNIGAITAIILLHLATR